MTFFRKRSAPVLVAVKMINDKKFEGYLIISMTDKIRHRLLLRVMNHIFIWLSRYYKMNTFIIFYLLYYCILTTHMTSQFTFTGMTVCELSKSINVYQHYISTKTSIFSPIFDKNTEKMFVLIEILLNMLFNKCVDNQSNWKIKICQIKIVSIMFYLYFWWQLYFHYQLWSLKS